MTNGQPAKISLGFAAVVLAMLPAVLDQTILATALPTIASDLGHLTDVSWIVTAYVVAAAASMPIWGNLGDRHGRKLVLEVSLAVFLAGSAAAGLAQDLTMLILARTIQGAAAGGLMTLAMAAVADLVSPRERGRFQGYITATFAVATVAGPLIGGLLVQHASWRWVFYVNLPIGALALAGLYSRLPSGATQKPGRRFDTSGAAILAGATGTLTLAAIWGGTRYAWGSPTIVALIGTTVLLAGALVVRERRAADPIVPLDLLRKAGVAIASAGMFLATASLFAITVFVPLYLQATTGATPTQAGLLLIPMMLGITVSTNFAGRRVERTGRYKVFPVTGLAVMATSLVVLALVAGHPSQTATGIAIAAFGLGFGMVSQILIVAVQNIAQGREMGIAMATANFFRGLGGAIGAAVLGAVFATRAGTIALSDGPTTLGTGARDEVIDGVRVVFGVAALTALAGLLIVIALKETPLRSGAPQDEKPPRQVGGESHATA